jgi:hypothetical protein
MTLPVHVRPRQRRSTLIGEPFGPTCLDLASALVGR